MKISNAARLIFWVAAIFAIGILVRAESGEKRANTPNTKSAPLRIVDQNGRPAVSGVPSATGQIVDVAVGPGGIVFRAGHSQHLGGRHGAVDLGRAAATVSPVALLASADSQFCSPNDTNCFPGVLSNKALFISILLHMPGSYSYFCFAHCVIGMTGVVNVSGGCAPSGWSAGADMPTPGVRSAGVYFPANGKFYAMGGRASDTAGSEFTHPFEYDPSTNTWTTKAATYPDNHGEQHGLRRAHRRRDAVHLLRGRLGSSAARPRTGRVFRYDPVTDTISPVAAPWPAGCGMILPGGFTCLQNKLYILGGFDTVTAMARDQPDLGVYSCPAGWVQKSTVLPVPLGYIPTTTIGSLIYTGGGSDITAATLTDTTNSFVYDPVANTIGTIAAIPRATGETRALNFNGQMLVMGGGRTAPNPSNEVDVYDPGTNAGQLVARFRRSRLRGATSQPTPTARPGFGWQAATTVTGVTDWPRRKSSAQLVELQRQRQLQRQRPQQLQRQLPQQPATATATPTVTPTPTPCEGRCTPTPRPRPTPAPRP